MHPHGVAEQEVARAGGEDRRRKACIVAVDRRDQRVLHVVAVGIDLRAASQNPSRETSTLSTSSLVWKVSPTLVTSDIGVPEAMAPGIGRPSCLARRPISSTSAPPAEVPIKPMFFASVFLSTLL